MSLDDGHATGYQLALSGRGPHMSDVVDIIDRSASPADAARVAAVVESYFLPCGCCASTRSSLMHPDEPAPHFEYFEHQAGADALARALRLAHALSPDLSVAEVTGPFLAPLMT
jgi:hypothetical protein